MGQLDALTRAIIVARINAFGERSPTATDFIVCPLLDETNGECRVYQYRPVTCRMYGFYVGRDGNQWCGDIQALYESGELNEVIFGNYDAVQRDLQRQGGDSKSLYEWCTTP